MSSQDEVRLAVPARPEFLGLARVTAAGLAGRLGFTFDQVEDLRLAIDEICFGLTGSKGRDGMLEVRFVLGPEGLVVNGRGQFSQAAPVHLSELSEVILDALVDEHSVSDGAGGPHFRLVKRRRAKPDGAGRQGAGHLSAGHLSAGHLSAGHLSAGHLSAGDPGGGDEGTGRGRAAQDDTGTEAPGEGQ